MDQIIETKPNEKKTNCLVCLTLCGEAAPPGGVIYEDPHWLVDHALPPVYFRGQLILKLKRHCEHLAELTPAESLAALQNHCCESPSSTPTYF